MSVLSRDTKGFVVLAGNNKGVDHRTISFFTVRVIVTMCMKLSVVQCAKCFPVPLAG